MVLDELLYKFQKEDTYLDGNNEKSHGSHSINASLHPTCLDEFHLIPRCSTTALFCALLLSVSLLCVFSNSMTLIGNVIYVNFQSRSTFNAFSIATIGWQLCQHQSYHSD